MDISGKILWPLRCKNVAILCRHWTFLVGFTFIIFKYIQRQIKLDLMAIYRKSLPKSL